MSRLRSIEQFFGAKTGPRRLGLVRIAIGTVGFVDALVTRHDLAILFRADALRVTQFTWLPELQAAHSDIYIGLWLLGSLLFTAGLFTRTAGTIVFTCIAYRFALDLTLYTTNIYLCGLLTLLLVLGDAGAAISLDQVKRGETPRLVPRWPQTLLKLQISLVYFFTAIEKINPQFLSGGSFKAFLSLPVILDAPWFYYAAGAATVLLELFLASALWSRRFRGWAFLWGFALHFLIPALIGFFAALMAYSVMFLGSFLLFVDEEPGSRWVSGRERELSWLRRLDWLRIHRYEPRDGTLSLKTDRGRLVGWAAFREVLRPLPISFLWASALDLPFIRRLGRAAYIRSTSAGIEPAYPPVDPAS